LFSRSGIAVAIVEKKGSGHKCGHRAQRIHNELLRSIAQTDRLTHLREGPAQIVLSGGHVGSGQRRCRIHYRNKAARFAPRLCSEPKSTTRTANFEIGLQKFADHEVSNWLEQSTGEKDRRLTAA
jgi:hypothetical protein